MNIVILASGGGGTLRFLDRALPLAGAQGRIVGVVADRPCGAVQSAVALGIASAVVGYDRGQPQALRDALKGFRPDLVVTTFHKLIDAGTLGVAGARFVNLHYSLLPAFAGLFPKQAIRAAQAAGSRIFGATCHEVDDSVDGGRILGQAAFPIEPGEIVEEILDLTYRSASLVLLNVVRALEGASATSASTAAIAGRPVLFSPAPAFDPAGFDESFWQTLKAAAA